MQDFGMKPRSIEICPDCEDEHMILVMEESDGHCEAYSIEPIENVHMIQEIFVNLVVNRVGLDYN